MRDLRTPWISVRGLFGHAWLLSLCLVAFAAPAGAAPHVAFAARAGVEAAAAAAHSWSPDAFLVYVENDEDVAAGGVAPRWGYLYYSPWLEKCRIYSVRDGRIAVAEDLTMKFDAPPLAGDWMDSGAALDAAEREVGREFREKHGGALGTMLLMRGAFNEGDPDETTWTLIYTAPHAPSLFVVVDASDGKVRRTWRG